MVISTMHGNMAIASSNPGTQSIGKFVCLLTNTSYKLLALVSDNPYYDEQRPK